MTWSRSSATCAAVPSPSCYYSLGGGAVRAQEVPLARPCGWGLVIRVDQSPPITPRFSSSPSWGAWWKPRVLPRSHAFSDPAQVLLSPPHTSIAAESWSAAPEGKFHVCPCGRSVRGLVGAGEAQLPLLQGSLALPSALAVGSSTLLPR
jgi:hypothetical protein